ncbi:MAG: hypothetical protein K0R55_3588 [Sporomusa sp.]|nr:hypothetical protein [Sporomusa sp.]
MKKTITLILCIIFAFSGNLVFAAPDDQSIKSSFQDLVKKHMDGYTDDPRVLVYYVPESVTYKVPVGWRKSKCIVLEDYSYDVEKTDSITTPYTAYLIYKMYIMVSPALATKELAESTEIFKENNTPNVYRISFSYQNGSWIPETYEAEFRIERSVPPIWRTITQDYWSAPYKRVVVKDLNNLK